MITGTHVQLYSKDSEADRAFFRDVLNFRSVDAGGGWLIFALSPAELSVHPSMDNFVQTHAEHSLLGAVLYLMCDDLDKVINELKSRNVNCTGIETAEWGITTSVKLPSGARSVFTSQLTQRRSSSANEN